MAPTSPRPVLDTDAYGGGTRAGQRRLCGCRRRRPL